MSEDSTEKKGISRRDFLTKAPLGIIGGIGVGVVAGKLLGTVLRDRVSPPQFPEDSIFKPAKDQTRL